MEKFVLRGDDAAVLRAQEQRQRSDRQRLRQTTIVDGPKVVRSYLCCFICLHGAVCMTGQDVVVQVVEEMVQHLKEELDAAKTTTNMLSILNALEHEHYISLEMLEKTRIGISLSRMQRRAESGVLDGSHCLSTFVSRSYRTNATALTRRMPLCCAS